MNWLSQLIALIGFSLRTLPDADRLRRRGDLRHRRRRGRARRRAVDRRRLPRADGGRRLARHGARPARRRRQRDDAACSIAQSTRRSSEPRPAWPAQTARPLVSPELFVIIDLPEALHGHRRQRADARRQSRQHSLVRPEVKIDRGTDVPVGHQRSHRRARRERAVREHSRSDRI